MSLSNTDIVKILYPLIHEHILFHLDFLIFFQTHFCFYFFNYDKNHHLNNFFYFEVIFLIYLLIMVLQLSHFCPFTQLHPAHPLPPTFPPYSSCPWVILISSLASTFPTLFLPFPCLFSPIIYATYSLYLSPPLPLLLPY